MTKKLLLTTALLSALSSGTTANATDFEIAYNGIILIPLMGQTMQALLF